MKIIAEDKHLLALMIIEDLLRSRSLEPVQKKVLNVLVSAVIAYEKIHSPAG